MVPSITLLTMNGPAGRLLYNYRLGVQPLRGAQNAYSFPQRNKPALARFKLNLTVDLSITSTNLSPTTKLWGWPWFWGRECGLC